MDALAPLGRGGSFLWVALQEEGRFVASPGVFRALGEMELKKQSRSGLIKSKSGDEGTYLGRMSWKALEVTLTTRRQAARSVLASSTRCTARRWKRLGASVLRRRRACLMLDSVRGTWTGSTSGTTQTERYEPALPVEKLRPVPLASRTVAVVGKNRV